MTQLEIFGSNQFQYSKSIVGIYRKPLANISLCILAPLPLNCLRSAYTISSDHPVKIRCLAIDDSGLVIVAPLLKFDGDCEKLLSQLIESIEETKLNILDSNGPITPILMENIKDARFWNIHNKTSSSLVEQWVEVARNNNYIEHISIDDFYKYLSDQLIENINESINYLNPFIKEVIILRPDLDLTIISNFMYRAKVYGVNALEYAKQALRIEPIPILRLIASDSTGKLFDTVFSGESLPKALSKYLVVESKIIRHLSVHARLIPDMSFSLLNALLTALSNIQSKYWPKTRKNWVITTEAIQACHLGPNDCVISDGGPWVGTVAACLKISVEPSRWQIYILKHFSSHVTLEKVAFLILKKLKELTPILALLQTLDAVSYDEKMQNFAFLLAKSFLENNPRQFSQLWLSIFPRLNPIYVNEYCFEIITSIEVCNYYGNLFDNCLQRDNQIMSNLFPNKMLFCISFNSNPVALMTVSIQDWNNNIYAQCHQLRGKGNREVDDVIQKTSVTFMDKLTTNNKAINDFYLFSNAMLNLCSSSFLTKMQKSY